MRILLADDEPSIRLTLGDALQDAGHEVEIVADGAAADERIAASRYDCAILDLKMPGVDGMELLRRLRERAPSTAVVVITGHSTIRSAVEAMKCGAYDYLAKPFMNDEVLLLLERLGGLRRLQDENLRLKDELDRRDRLVDIVGTSRAMQGVYNVIETVAPRDAGVLVTGESGTGKELVAEAIHAMSDRRSRPLVKVPCSVLPATLLEDELFGHEKGAFTDAREARAGRFEQADGGSIFLDDIDDLPEPMQAKFLRVLQEREFTRLGATRVTRVDIRVIAATKKDLRDEVEAGRFREDLFYRLNIVPIELPPLRERIEDLPLLAAHFVGLHGGQHEIPPDVLEGMMAYPWPGNVRELRNAVERAIALAGPDGHLEREHLIPQPAGGTTPTVPEARGDAVRPLREAARAAERAEIRKALEATDGERQKAADLLGISRKTLWQKMKEMGEEKSE